MPATLVWTGLVIGVLVLAGLGASYVRGIVRLRRHDGGHRHVGRPWALVAGIVVAAIVTTPPVGEMLEKRLATHMVQHMTLIVVAAPLLAMSGCGLPLLVGLPGVVRRRLVRLQRRFPASGIVGPHAAWGMYIAALWLWHLPAAYDEALRSTAAHVTEHACFLLTAWLFWWHIAGPPRRRLARLPAALYLAAAIPPGAAIGAWLIFAQHPIYAAQARTASASGADPLSDQRLAGIVMWVPMDFVFVGVVVALIGGWLRFLQRRWPEPVYDVIPDYPSDQRPVGSSR